MGMIIIIEEGKVSHVAKSGSLDFVARDKRLDSRQSNSGNGRLSSANDWAGGGNAHGRGVGGGGTNGSGCVQDKPGILREFATYGTVWDERERTSGCFLSRKRHFPLIWIWASVRLPPIKLITYFHGSRALRWPNAERSPRTLSKGNKNAREKNSIQLWQNIRYNPSPPFNNPHTYPLFPTIMSDSPADDGLDDHKLPDELEGGAQLAGNSDTGRSPSPFLLSRVTL